MSGGGKSTTQTVQNYSPEEAALRSQVMNLGLSTYGQTAGKLSTSGYPGAQPVPFNPLQQAGQTAAVGAAAGAVPTINAANQATQFGLGPVLYPQSNPALQATIDAATRPIIQQYTDPGGAFSQLRTDSLLSGPSSRDQILGGVLGGRLATAIGDTSANVATAGYNQGLDTFARTLALTPQTLQSMLFPAQTLSAVGDAQQGQAQAQENYAAEGRIWDLNKDWLALQNLANIIYGAGSSTSTSTAQLPGTSPLLGAAGGALGGAGAGAAAGAQIGSGYPGVGTAIGAVLGGLLGYFGSR